ncbi:MAG: ABC-F family ATP-binding cassette domain-containing protein [Chitinophagaceae bacterium]|nr:ABC-F family ATP-binding cassette domain-containing protein [Chitinophagaceae bacterium]
MLAGLQDVTFEFGARTIVRDATWHIQPGERIGLIGFNGTGKSTLLKVLIGEYHSSSGSVERGKGVSIGYLHQDLLSFDTEESIFEVAIGAFAHILSLEKEIDVLGKRLEKDSENEALLHEYSDKLHELELAGGYDIHHRTEEVLQGLGFSNADLQRPYKEFSGGWRMRVLLAKMILQQPDLLLLDEPTNHLDLPSIEWLEKYLVHYKGSVVIVSHDKYFLNRMVTKIVELYQQQLHFYNGDFDFYETEKEMRLTLQQRAYENQQEYIRQQERFIERFRAKATKAAAAQSAIKRLDKLERIEDVSVDRPEIRINFQLDKIPGKIICTLKHASKRFGDIRIVENASAEINRGDKIALIGANGKGKSTLLRMIAGTETFDGERIWGHNVEASFYAQHQLEALNLQHTLLEEMKSCGSQKTEQELRALLGCFLFSGDDVDKKIRVLSGGEKARVALAKTIIGRANFLILDEPTNHLDMLSIDLLIEALNKYEGTVIMVSHDRHFISKAANRIWEIENFEIKDFAGGYEEWLLWKERKRVAAEKETGEVKTQAPNNNSKDEKKEADEKQQPAQLSKPGGNGAINKELKKEIQKYQKNLQQLEEKLNSLTQKKKELEALLASPDIYADKEKFLQAESNYQKSVETLARADKEYEKVFEKLLELEEKSR